MLLAAQSAELARRVAAAFGHGTSGVEVRVHHGVSTEGMTGGIVDAVDGDGHPWSETILSASLGVSTSARLRRSTVARSSEGLTDNSHVNVVAVDGPRHFEGTSRHNPSFLYEGARALEVYLRFPTYGSPSGLDLRHGVAATHAVAAVAAAAQRQGAPILFLQSPASPPPPSPGTTDDSPDTTVRLSWRSSQSFGLRFAVALNDGEYRPRLDFFRDVSAFAERVGCKVSIGDRRGDRRGGNWFEVLSADTDAYDEWLRDHAGPHAVDCRYVFPVTFTGPARVGTTSELATAIKAAGLPLMACTVTALDDQAVITGLIGTSAGPPHVDDPVAGTVEVPKARDGLPPQRIEGTASALCQTVRVLREESLHVATAAAGDLTIARDYRGFGGPMFRVRGTYPSGRRVGWGAFRIGPGNEALTVCLDALQEAITSLTPGGDWGEVEYVRSRQSPHGFIVGRIKVGLRSEVLEGVRANRERDPKNEWFRQVEQHWRTKVRELISADSDVEFAWREMWLGRWLTLNGE